MSTGGHDIQLRLRDKPVHGFALTHRDDAVGFAPDQQYRHPETRQQVVRRVFALQHSVEGSVYYPRMLSGEPENIPCYETRDMWRMRHKQSIELV